MSDIKVHEIYNNSEKEYSKKLMRNKIANNYIKLT